MVVDRGVDRGGEIRRCHLVLGIDLDRAPRARSSSLLRR
jgi:hypothetical protein